MERSEVIVNLIPAINEIVGSPLRKAVTATWEKAWCASPYENLGDVPQGRKTPDRPLLIHVNEVNNCALTLLALAESEFNLQPDRDTTLSAAILHDVDKPLLFRRTEKGCEFVEGRTQADHGPLGAQLALEHGVPENVATMVRHHYPFTDVPLPATLEATILYYADLSAADFGLLKVGQQPLQAHVKMQYI